MLAPCQRESTLNSLDNIPAVIIPKRGIVQTSDMLGGGRR